MKAGADPARLFSSRIFRRLFFSHLALIACGTAVLAFALGVRASAEFRERQSAVGERTRDQLEASLKEWSGSRIAALRAAAALLGEEKSSNIPSDEVCARLSLIQGAHPDFIDIAIIDSRGLIVNATAPATRNRSIQVADREYFREAMEGGVGITGFFVGRSMKKQVMTVAVRFESSDRESFVATAFVTLESFAATMNALNQGRLGRAYLVDADDRLVLGPSDLAPASKVDNPAALAASKGERGTARYVSAAGDEVLGAYSWIDDLDSGLVIEVERDLFMEPLERFLRLGILIVAAFVAFAALVSYLIAARIYKSLEVLSRAVDGLAEADYKAQPGKGNSSEMDFLIERVNKARGAAAAREQSLQDDARRDSLTGLYNHAALLGHLERSLRTPGASVHFVMLDIDRFKTVNDEYGHQAGDAVLKGIAELMRAAVRSNDMVGRYGGEEFALVLAESSEEDTGALCERLRRLIEAARFGEGQSAIAVTASLGWSSSPGDAASLVALADAALYRAKAAGRNRVERG